MDSDERLIHHDDLDGWARRLHSLPGITGLQQRAVQNFTESCVRFISRRAELHMVAIQFHEADKLNKTTMEIQGDYYYRTEIFFHGFYSCLSQLANVTHRFPHFNGIAASSNEKFLAALRKKYENLKVPCAILEDARSHRAFLDHPVSNQVSDWMTYSTGDARVLQVMHFGELGKAGGMPDGAVAGDFGPIHSGWHKITPDRYDIEKSLKRAIGFIVDELESATKAS